MTVEEAVRTLIVGDTRTSTIFGDKVYPGYPPDHTLSTPPWIAYRVVNEVPFSTLDARVAVITEIEFDVLCDTYSSVRAGVSALVQVLDGHEGEHIDQSRWQGTEFEEVQEGHLAKLKFVFNAR